MANSKCRLSIALVFFCLSVFIVTHEWGMAYSTEVTSPVGTKYQINIEEYPFRASCEHMSGFDVIGIRPSLFSEDRSYWLVMDYEEV